MWLYAAAYLLQVSDPAGAEGVHVAAHGLEVGRIEGAIHHLRIWGMDEILLRPLILPSVTTI